MSPILPWELWLMIFKLRNQFQWIQRKKQIYLLLEKLEKFNYPPIRYFDGLRCFVGDQKQYMLEWDIVTYQRTFNMYKMKYGFNFEGVFEVKTSVGHLTYN